MNIFDDKNLFDDDFDLLSESADSLFGDSINKTPEKLVKQEEKTIEKIEEKNIEKNADKLQEKQKEKIAENTENKGNEPLKEDNLKNKKRDNKKQEKIKKVKEKKSKKNSQEITEKDEQSEIEEAVTEISKLDAEQIQQQNDQGQALTKDINDKKSSKVKAEKEPKEKKPRKKLSKKAIIIICCFAVVFAIIVTIFAFYIKKINTKLAMPSCSVVQLQSATIISIDKVEDAICYEICITKAGTNNPTTFKTVNTVIELKSFLNQPGQFNVKVRALGKTKNATSDYSESVSITNYITLKTPNVFKDGNILSWNPVEKAVKYKLFYRANLDSDLVDFIELDQNENLITFDLSTLNQYGPGLYPISVQAICSDEPYYLNSACSSTINYEYYAQLQEPAKAKLNMTSKTLAFTLYKQGYIPTQFKLSVLLEGSYQKEEYTIYTQELIGKEITFNNFDALEFSANLSDIINPEIVSATLTSITDNSYATNSNDCEVDIEY